MYNLRDSALVRSFIWRIGRKLYAWARHDLTQAPTRNGEYWLLGQIAASSSFSNPVFIDVGAHLGLWSSCAEANISRAGSHGHVYAFEPSNDSFLFLSEKFKSTNCISIEKIALSDKSCATNFFIFGEKFGINSLCKSSDAVAIEQIHSYRLDDFLGQRKINHVVFVKSDTEGHDFNVICGATDSFQKGLIEVWQFEYNHRWLAARKQLKDVFEFIADKPYRLGKLYSNGIEIYEQWHPELERFFEANYVLIKRGSEFENLCKPVRFNYKNVLVPLVV